MLNRARVDSEDTVLMTGATGGVGTGLLQLVRGRGVDVIALTSALKRDRVREQLGIEKTVARDKESILETLDALLKDDHIAFVADVVGSDLFQQFLEILRPGGRLVTAGVIAGPTVEIDLRTIYLDQLEVIGRRWTRKVSLKIWSAMLYRGSGGSARTGRIISSFGDSQGTTLLHGERLRRERSCRSLVSNLVSKVSGQPSILIVQKHRS